MGVEASGEGSLPGRSATEVLHLLPLLPRCHRHIGAGKPSAVGNTGDINRDQDVVFKVCKGDRKRRNAQKGHM